jgi:glycosyltransferase involved in cell wall biosynthesis
MMKISIVGTRGIPAAYGGFETFAERISELLVRQGFRVSVQCDPAYGNRQSEWNGVELFFAPVSKSANPLRYYYSGLRHALKNSDVVLVTASAGALFYFLNLRYRKIIITNPDGLEWKRMKWSFLKRLYLRITEMLSLRFSSVVIADSVAIRDYLFNSYGLFKPTVAVIEYGANINHSFNPEVLDRFGLRFRDYYLIVSRIEPENNLPIIIEGYLASGSALPLIIAGSTDSGSYSLKIAKKYKSENVRFIGGLYDNEAMNSLRFGCFAYIHGHSVGGTNPSLLESMANSNITLCHDNVFNREVTGGSQLYFLDATGCAAGIKKLELLPASDLEELRRLSLRRISDYYNWDNMLNKYLALFSSLGFEKADPAV